MVKKLLLFRTSFPVPRLKCAHKFCSLIRTFDNLKKIKDCNKYQKKSRDEKVAKTKNRDFITKNREH